MDNLITEGKVTIDALNFTVYTLVDRKGLGINFIPDSKSLEVIYVNGKNSVVDKIEKALHRVAPMLAESLWFESGHDAAGFTFRIDPYELSEQLTKALK
jgi:hypothetical protein